MNIIKTYLENMFAGFPNTKEVLKMKEDLMLNMEEKYNELKGSGKTENEAIGIVISEFGNIEELALELGVNITPTEETKTVVTEEIANEYMTVSRRSGLIISIGVFLCIISPILLILLSGNIISSKTEMSQGILIGIVTLLVLVALAVGLFVYAGMNLAKFDYLKRDIIVPLRVKEMVKREKSNFDPKFTIGLIITVTMYILSPVTLIIFALINDTLTEDKYDYLVGVAILLVIVATATLIISRLGIIKNSHNVLLQIESYTPNRKKSEKAVEAIAGIYWPLVTAAYLLWSFLSNSWDISWLIWPIAGIVFGSIASIINATTKNE